MLSKATTPQQYLAALPDEQGVAVKALRDVIISNLPKGFSERMEYGMLAYTVPLTIYPAGYHCKPDQPLPFVSIASQKNGISFYHMGIYAMPDLLNWFVSEYPKHSTKKLDMGKSCIRFKKPGDIPYKLIGELIKKVSVKEWINVYEKNIKK